MSSINDSVIYFLLMIYNGSPCPSEGALTLSEHMKVVSLPSCSPELNPQENNWNDMREEFFKNTVFNSMHAVETQLVLTCNFYKLNPDIIVL